jgi:hypothetical protein
MTDRKIPWAVGPHRWPVQIGCCPLVGQPYSIHGTDNYNVAAANNEADAHLIAAAPDLLDALETLLETHIAHHNLPEHAAARAVIRKARGQS